jgi:hypothetical protein
MMYHIHSCCVFLINSFLQKIPSYLIKTFFSSVSPCFRDRHDEFQEDDFRWIKKSTNLDVDYNWSCLFI